MTLDRVLCRDRDGRLGTRGSVCPDYGPLVTEREADDESMGGSGNSRDPARRLADPLKYAGNVRLAFADGRSELGGVAYSLPDIAPVAAPIGQSVLITPTYPFTGGTALDRVMTDTQGGSPRRSERDRLHA